MEATEGAEWVGAGGGGRGRGGLRGQVSTFKCKCTQEQLRTKKTGSLLQAATPRITTDQIRSVWYFLQAR